MSMIQKEFYEIIHELRQLEAHYGEDSLEIIENALKMQIPEKPFLEGDGYADGEMVYDTWRCPNCDTAYEIEFDDYGYCPNCGQRIEWGDENK